MNIVETDVLNGDDRCKWLISEKDRLAKNFSLKYIAGQIEHSGDLGSIPINELVGHLENELLDAWAYLAEIRRRLNLSSAKELDTDGFGKLVKPDTDSRLV